MALTAEQLKERGQQWMAENFIKRKAASIQGAKNTANAKLARTDWYITRLTETGVAIPQNIVEERAAIKAECNETEAMWTAATTMEDVQAAIKAKYEAQQTA